MKKYRWRYRGGRAQAGQALVLIALLMPVLLGFLGLAIDYGRLVAERRKLQNYADAATLSGAQDLSLYAGNACSDAQHNLTTDLGNNPPGYTSVPACLGTPSDTTTPGVYVYHNPNDTSQVDASIDDTIRVNLKSTVPLAFLPALGLGLENVTASATAKVSSVTGCNDSATDFCAPYAAWRPQTGSPQCAQFQIGTYVIFRDDQWANDTGAGNCPALWNVTSDDFKGFVRPDGSPLTIGTHSLSTKGGNACGQEPVQSVQDAAAAGETLIIPIIDTGTGNGQSTVTIPGFISLSLNFVYPYPGQNQAITVNGNPSSGDFKLGFNGASTTSIPYNATATQVQAALEALSTVGSGNVSVTGANGGPWIVNFQGSLAGQSLPAITADYSGFDDSGATVSVYVSPTISGLEGTTSQSGDYTCPATWIAKVVGTGTGAGGVGGVTPGGACLSSFYSCSIRLQ